MNPRVGLRLRRARWAALPVAALYAWWASSLRPFTAPALAIVLLTGGLVLAIGARLREGRSQEPALPSAWPWVVLFGALAAWELAAFVQLPRAENPTLSSLANEVFDGHLVRTVAFLTWMAAGFGIARR